MASARCLSGLAGTNPVRPLAHRPLLRPLRAHQDRRQVHCCHWTRPEPLNPAYLEYLTRDQRNRHDDRQAWAIVTAGRGRRMNVFTYLFFPLQWLHYEVSPLPIRFLLSKLNRAVLKPLHRLHGRYVILRCRLAALFSRKPRDVYRKTRGRQSRFSIGRALVWYHGREVHEARRRAMLSDELARREDPFLRA